jgi:hypothetical protein
MRPWKIGVVGSLAKRAGIVHHGPLARIVAKTGVAVPAARAAKDVLIAVQARAGQKAGRVVAADDLSKDSRLISN